MYDGVGALRMQRSSGSARVSLHQRDQRTRLTDLQQSGSAKAFLPQVAGDPEVVFLNTSGGLTGGDRLEYALDLGADTRVTGTTQTAERGYASTGDAADVRFSGTVGAGAHLDWLPQETILFESAHIRRDTAITLADDAASCVMLESIVLGRHAMGERPQAARLTDRRMIRRGTRPVWAESLRIDAGLLADADTPAVLGGARALAVIALVAPGAADAASPLRAVLDEPGVQSAVSGWDGKCVVRLLAHEGWPLRCQIARVLAVLRPGGLPRVWQMQGESA